MSEKKIFLAYIYRTLQVLYAYLYKVRAYAVFSDLCVYHDDRQCCHREDLMSAEYNLQLHYETARKIMVMYKAKPLNSSICNIIDKLLRGETPTIQEGIESGLIKYSVDCYNPIFSSLLSHN